MERTVTVRTPESIAFQYELAGLGSRFLAVAIDQVIQVAVLLGFFFFWIFTTTRIDALARAAHMNSTRLAAIYLAVLFTVLFIIEIGYFIIFEMLWNGQTPGKRIMGIRVVRDGGYPIEFMSSLIRNLVRVVEFGIGFYAMSVVSVAVSQQNKRLGDLAAGTIVVRDRAFEVTDPKRWLSGDYGAGMGQRIRGVEQLSAQELAIVQRYVERRTVLPPIVATQTAARIAGSLRSKLGPDTASLGNDELLVRIAASARR